MKVLILGANGFVGKNISIFLNKNTNHKIISHNRSKCDLSKSHETTNYIRKIQPNFVINAAGKVGGIVSHLGNNYDFLIQNTILNINIVNGLIDNGIKKFLNLSSSCAYPTNIKEPFNEKDFVFGNFEPTNEGYAIAKQLTNYLIKFSIKEKGLNYKQIIPSNLFGPYDDFSKTKSHLVASIVKKCHEFKIGKTKKIEILGSGKPKRQFLFVEDLAKLVNSYINNYNKFPSTVNFASKYNYSVKNYHEKIFKIICKSKINESFIYNKKFPDGVYSKKISNKRLKKYYNPQFTSFESSILKTYKYFLQTTND